MEDDYTYIVLADDDDDDRLLFTEAFYELKIKSTVDTYEDGVALMDALKHPDAAIPNILFLDLNMPKKSGLDCLKEIRSNNKFQDMAIAIFSTSASDADIENTFINGANIYIKKPNNFKNLKKVLFDVVTINWQYHTNNLNRENFLLRL
jgi:CheY-like chemotaxis protein